MHLSKVTEVLRHNRYIHLNIVSFQIRPIAYILMVTLLLCAQLQIVTAAPTLSADVTTNIPITAETTERATVKTSSDDTSSTHFFYDVPAAASTILITVFAGIFSYGLSVAIKVFCPDQCDHRGTCANNNTTSFCRRYRRTVNPLSKCSEQEETKSYHSQYPLPVIGIPNGRPNYKENVEQWLQQVDHTVGVPDESGHGAEYDELDPDKNISVTYDCELIKKPVNDKMSHNTMNTNITAVCANKELNNLFVVMPVAPQTETDKKGTTNIEQHKHNFIVQVEINECIPKNELVTSPEVKSPITDEVQSNEWNRRESRKGSSPDDCSLKENDPLLYSPTHTNSTVLSTPNLATPQKHQSSSITLETNTDDTSVKERITDVDRGQYFPSIKEDTVFQPSFQ